MQEAERLAALHALGILDTPPEREFDTVVECARRLLGVPNALISLVDANRQWFKARCIGDVDETERDVAFCSHAVAADALLVVPDARLDPRFATNPLVLGPPHIRFYAGMPLHVATIDDAAGRHPVGTLCVIDDRPRALDADGERTLRDLAALAESLLDARLARQRAERVAEERRTALEKLDRSHRQFRQAERIANIGSWRIALDDNRTEWSDHVYAIHGLPVSESPPLAQALRFYPPRARAELSAALARTIETGEPFDIQADFVTAQGQPRRVHSVGELETRDGRPHALIGVFQDVTERHRMEQALRRSATTDELTGLANRAQINSELDRRIAAANTHGEPLALLLIDLDNFKTVNDRCGHQAGDELLRFVADRLRASALRGSFAGRLGGDEFVLLLSDADLLADLEATIAHLLMSLRHTTLCDGHTVDAAATIGACRLDPAEGIDRSVLLGRADEALYDAKEDMRGTARISGEDGRIAAAAPARPLSAQA